MQRHRPPAPRATASATTPEAGSAQSRPSAIDDRTGGYRSVAVEFRSSSSEVGVDVDHRRTEHDDEQRREDAEHHRDEHLDRRLLRPLLSELTALDPHLVGLRPEDTADRN